MGGVSAGFITTTVNLPSAAAGQNIVLRWRMGSDNSTAGVGWRVDSVVLSQPGACPAGSPTPTATANSLHRRQQQQPLHTYSYSDSHLYADAYGHSNVHAYSNSNCYSGNPDSNGNSNVRCIRG